MAKWKSVAHLLTAFSAMASSGRYRTARARRYVFRHPKAHRRVINRLLRMDAEHLQGIRATNRKNALAWERAPLAPGGLKRRMR